ncbi:MAG: protein translocase subunit SecF [Candidatus Doudnabacteria bacterium]|nr:protein translocase subunit SecF [Candidatus Doudnabacteria bacterium]
MLRVTKYRKIFFLISGLLVAASIVSLAVFRLNFGIDFVGGSILELNFKTSPSAQNLAESLAAAGYPNVVVQPGQNGNVIIKTQSLTSQADREKLFELIKAGYGEFEELRFDTIGPLIGKELRSKAVWQIFLVTVGILFYIAYAFRKVGQAKTEKRVSAWRLGLAAIIALAHDLIIVLGVFSLLGRFGGVQVDSLFVTSLLTVLGFSVHDTIVVFDRLRENMQKDLGLDFEEVVNFSINQTLTRSLNTSMTVILVLLALVLFGGTSTFFFSISLLVGITVGTYSSIYIASALLVAWRKN